MRPTRAAVALALIVAAGPAAAQEEGGGNVFSNLFRFGGTTVPPSQPGSLDAAYCPNVDVADGGAAMQAYGGARTGDQTSLRSQITLGALARECAAQPDGSVVVRIGIEGRALLGPGGAPGRFTAPVRIVLKFKDKPFVTRARQVAVTVPPGASRGDFAFVEEGIAVPAAYARDYEIEVGLGGGAPRPARPARSPKPSTDG